MLLLTLVVVCCCLCVKGGKCGEAWSYAARLFEEGVPPWCAARSCAQCVSRADARRDPSVIDVGGILRDLPTFDWRSVTSALLGALALWASQLFKKKDK